MGVEFNTEDVVVTIAGAGSGKTSALMTELTGMLKTYRPGEVAFTTFTRKGVATGIERAIETVPSLTAADLPYFQTLHKMCFKEAGLSRKNIMEAWDIAKFNELLGFDVRLVQAFSVQTEGTKMYQRYNATRNGATTGIYVDSTYDEKKYYRFVKAYEAYKEKNNLVDFQDCLERYLEHGKPLPVAVFFLDEAQDITEMQWDVIKLASANAEKIRIAGDPAQTIFSFAGSRPETLIELTKRYKTVDINKTYRMPKQICKVADSVMSLMQGNVVRKHKAAKETEGIVKDGITRVVLARMIKKDWDADHASPNKWFLLFRCNANTSSMGRELEKLLIPYHNAKGFCINPVSLAKIVRYYNFRKKGFSTDAVRDAFKVKYEIKDFDDDFTESKLIPSERRYVYFDYVEKYGIDALNKMAVSPPWCLLTTTYRVKGGEADNVAVFLDATKQVASNVMVDLDGELRVLYVACTRAKEALYIIEPECKFNIRSLWEATVENIA